jgi:hypothetical protein
MYPVFNDMQGIYACPSIIVFLREMLLLLNLTFYLKETNIKVPELHKVTNFGKCAFSFVAYALPFLCERNFRIIRV